MNINADVSKGISTFKVNIISPKGVIEQSHVSPIEFQTDKEALLAFKSQFAGQDFNDCFTKNLHLEDVLCTFTNPAGYKYEFVRNSFRPWGGKR